MTVTPFRSAFYEGRVLHVRLRPKAHRLNYRLHWMFLDLDELPALDRHLPLFAWNRAAAVSFHDRDHGPLDGTPLRPWVESRLREAGIEPDGGAVRLFTCPRMFGYVFNPLSVYFCYAQDGTLIALVYEVCNTFRERHSYVVPLAASGERDRRHGCDKALYVSPFIGMYCTYRFHVRLPGARFRLLIRVGDGAGPLLDAAFHGTRRPLTTATPLRLICRAPLMTFGIIAGIHWEALKLRLKGLKVFAHHAADNRVAHSIVKPGSGT